MIKEKTRRMPIGATPTRIMTVLPPKEGFSPDAVGAIGLLVHRLAQPGDWVVGSVLKNAAFSGIHYLGIHTGWMGRLNRNMAYAQGVVSFVKRYQPLLVEIHNRPELALYLAHYLARQASDIKVVLILHNDPLTMRAAKTVRQRQKLAEMLHVVTVSEWLRSRFLSGIEGKLLQDKVICLPNSIDPACLPPYVPVSQREKLILFAGRVVADKGADLFVQLCQRVAAQETGWRMEMIGADRFSCESQETDFIRNLKHQITEGKHGRDMVMTGYLPHDQVLAKMAQAAVVILPSRWHEPFGMTALEAMACGTPLLVSDRGALPEVVGDGALVMDPENMDQAYEILSHLLTDQKVQETLSVKARHRSRQFASTDALIRLNQFRKQICPSLSFPPS